MKIVFAIIIICSVLFTKPAIAKMETYKFDLGHTELLFSYRHLGMSRAYVQFKGLAGVVKMDKSAPEKSSVNVTIDTSTVDTGLELFDGHLKGKNFFDVANHPKATFKSTKIEMGEGKNFKVHGDLTIKGKTRPVILDAVFIIDQPHPLGIVSAKYKDVYVAAFSAKTTIKRSEFGMGQFTPATSDEVDIIIETEMFRQ